MTMRHIIVPGVISVALSIASIGLAQNREDARSVAAGVQSFYQRTPALTADFYQTTVTPLYSRTQRAHGRVIFKKPGKMRWNYDTPERKIIVSDGSKVQQYEPSANQVIEQRIDQSQLPQAFSFLMGSGRLDADFTFRLLDSRRHGFPNGYVLELRPRRPTPHYDRIVFYVVYAGTGTRRAAVVHRVLIIDAAGNRNRFDFSNMTFAAVPDSEFRWRPPRNVRVVHP